jgi:hypothetical protein
MSDSTPSSTSQYDAGNEIRPLSVRMTESSRAQLDIIAQLNNRSVTEEVREALEKWIEISKSDPKILQRAEAVQAEINREAATKQGAIAAIFGPKPETAAKPKASPNGSASTARGEKPSP